ncbi:hypothetical protein WDW89_06735 [Deltaproteobacteria bacterium TL4]
MIPMMMILGFISILILNWYQQEIQHRFQIQSLLRTHSIYQELEGVLTWTQDWLPQHSLEEFRNSISLNSLEFDRYFPEWQVSVGMDNTHLMVQMNYDLLGESVRFDALYQIKRQNLTDLPWLIAGGKVKHLPEFLIFEEQEDQNLSQRFLKAIILSDKAQKAEVFDYTFYGETAMEWNESGVHIRQGEKEETPILAPSRIKVFGNATLALRKSRSVPTSVTIQTTQNLTIEGEDSAKSFSKEEPLLFATIGETLVLQGILWAASSLQIQGYVQIKGNHCLKVQGLVTVVYWKGSVLCEGTLDPEQVPNMVLQSYPVKGSLPLSFQKDLVQYDGIRMIQE